MYVLQVEVLWSTGVRKLPPLSPLLVKGRNLYKQKTYRQVSVFASLYQCYLFRATVCYFHYPSWYRDGKMKLIESKYYMRSTNAVQRRDLREHWRTKREAVLRTNLKVIFEFQQPGLLHCLIVFHSIGGNFSLNSCNY